MRGPASVSEPAITPSSEPKPLLLLTRIGVPAPFTVDTIIEIKQPKKMTAPNTIACCGYLDTMLFL